jgi:hypothetical protein
VFSFGISTNSMLSSSSAAIISLYEDSEKFPVIRGVKQGDINSPGKLKVSALMVYTLRFADDIATPTRSPLFKYT